MQKKSSICNLFLICTILFALVGLTTYGQSHRHWTRSFNEESSLLSGAVVGGGIGPSAIYYNPAGIADVDNSSLSFHASLFSFEFYTLRDILGENIDLSSMKGLIQPRFISYLVQPNRNKDFSIELAYLNNELYNVEFNKSIDENIDILKALPGDERYFSDFSYFQEYREDWIGVGASWRVNPSLFLGGSMFVMFKHFEYRLYLDIEAFQPVDSIATSIGNIPFYSANYQDIEYIHLDNYRFIWKVGLLYKKERFSFGVTLRTPSLNIYSDGKRISHKEKQSNIMKPGTTDFLPNYVVVDYQEKKDVDVNLKDPFSIAVGATIYLPDNKKTVFTTVEYFNGINPYNAISAEMDSPSFPGSNVDPVQLQNWLTYGHGAKPILNAALGYRWEVKENLLVMAGFRTDFNYRKGLKTLEEDFQVTKSLELDVYHLTGGLSLRVLGQDLITGIQYSIGRQSNVNQYVNFADPVEYNLEEMKPLVGTSEPVGTILYNSISFYFGATLNFNKD